VTNRQRHVKSRPYALPYYEKHPLCLALMEQAAGTRALDQQGWQLERRHGRVVVVWPTTTTQPSMSSSSVHPGAGGRLQTSMIQVVQVIVVSAMVAGYARAPVCKSCAGGHWLAPTYPQRDGSRPAPVAANHTCCSLVGAYGLTINVIRQPLGPARPCIDARRPGGKDAARPDSPHQPLRPKLREWHQRPSAGRDCKPSRAGCAASS
jgi:hypothetical protein